MSNESELIKSYFHARDIAIAQFSDQRKYNMRETGYLFLHNKLTIKDSKYSNDHIFMIIRKDLRLLENPVFFDQIPGGLLAKMYNGDSDTILTGLRMSVRSAKEKLTPEYLNSMDDKRIADFISGSKNKDVVDLFTPERLKAIKGTALAEILLYGGTNETILGSEFHEKFNFDNLNGDGMIRIITNYSLKEYYPRKRTMLMTQMNLDKLSEWNIIQLLRYDPKFIDLVDVSKVKNSQWVENLLMKSPQLAKYFEHLYK